jgi:hypothetical protein
MILLRSGVTVLLSMFCEPSYCCNGLAAGSFRLGGIVKCCWGLTLYARQRGKLAFDPDQSHASWLQRPTKSAEHPADSEGHERGRIGLGFDRVPEPRIERARSLARNVGSLAVEVLGSAGGLIHHAFCLRFRIAGNSAEALLHLAS